MGHQAVLDAIGCADLTQLVDQKFLHRFNLQQPVQYGLVAADVPASIQRLRELGASAFVYANPRIPSWTERGKQRSDVSIEVALGYSNHQQLELLGAGRNTDIYAERIPTDCSIALHHVCIYHDQIVALEPQLNAAGFETVLSGDLGLRNIFTIRFRYFDTREALGFYLEVCEFLAFNRQVTFGERSILFGARLQQLVGRPSR